MPTYEHHHSARAKTKYTYAQDQMDMTSHMPQTFHICETCAPSLYHLSLTTMKNTTAKISSHTHSQCKHDEPTKIL